jgi:Uma2 family endonuclease
MTTTTIDTAAASRRRITLQEYKSLPEGPPKFEFENGELIPMTQPTPEHQDVLVEFCHELRGHVLAQKLGRVFMEPDVYLPDGRAYIPDIVYVSTANLNIYDEQDKSIHGSPDLCVEILSTRPSRDRVEKFKAYAENKVPWYWLLEPIELSIEEYRLTDAGYLRTASVLVGELFRPVLFPGLVLDLKKLMEPGATAGPALP